MMDLWMPPLLLSSSWAWLAAAVVRCVRQATEYAVVVVVVVRGG